MRTAQYVTMFQANIYKTIIQKSDAIITSLTTRVLLRSLLSAVPVYTQPVLPFHICQQAKTARWATLDGPMRAHVTREDPDRCTRRALKAGWQGGVVTGTRRVEPGVEIRGARCTRRRYGAKLDGYHSLQAFYPYTVHQHRGEVPLTTVLGGQ